MNDYLPKGILKTMELLAEVTRPYQIAFDTLKQNAELVAALSNPNVSKLGVMDDALKKDLFDDESAKLLSKLLLSYHELTGTQVAIKALGSSFKEMLKPEKYASVKTMSTAITKLAQSSESIQVMQSAVVPLIQATETVDTSWLKDSSAWKVDKSLLSNLNVNTISGLSSAFSHLCALEHETSLLANIPETITSAASQIASITESIDRELQTGWKYNYFLSTSTLIRDYCSLATSQHESIRKASNPKEISWRLGIVDVASRFVDRQLDWYLDFTNTIADETISVSDEIKIKAESTPLPLIPTYLGYTRRVDITPIEGFEESAIIAITEKGKIIANNALLINRLRLDAGEERIFELSETVIMGMLDLSTVVCNTEEQLGRIIDSLYFLFYENLIHIKTFLGHGNENKGEQLVRKEDIYQCIFDVKTIRCDFRHDLNHGDPSKVKRKRKSVGDCYKKYCGTRPLKTKDFKKLQNSIYDKIVALEDSLIQMMLEETDC